MVSKESRSEIREKKHYRLRAHLAGTAERPRLAVFRSNKNIYAQIIDDDAQNLLRVESRPLQRIIDSVEEFLLSFITGTEAVCGIGFDDAVEHQGQIHILAQVVVKRFLAL